MSQGPVPATRLLNLRHIEVFHAIYSNGSTSAAALVLNVSQPSISKTLRYAEDRLGFALFHRAKGRLVPTDNAHLLFAEIDEVYDKISSLQRSAQNLGAKADTLKIFTLPGLALDFLPRIVSRFRALEPKARFELETLHSADALRRLRNRDCDLVIGCEAPIHPQLVNEQIGSGQLVVLHKTGLLGEEPAVMDHKAIEQHRLIAMSTDSGPLAQLFHREVTHRDINLDTNLSVGTMYIGGALARVGPVLAVIDDLTAPAFLTDGLSASPFHPPIEYKIFSTHLADRPLSRIAMRFLKTLRDALSDRGTHLSRP